MTKIVGYLTGGLLFGAFVTAWGAWVVVSDQSDTISALVQRVEQRDAYIETLQQTVQKYESLADSVQALARQAGTVAAVDISDIRRRFGLPDVQAARRDSTLRSGS